jgi:hypothetical protein
MSRCSCCLLALHRVRESGTTLLTLHGHTTMFGRCLHRTMSLNVGESVRTDYLLISPLENLHPWLGLLSYKCVHLLDCSGFDQGSKQTGDIGNSSGSWACNNRIREGPRQVGCLDLLSGIHILKVDLRSTIRCDCLAIHKHWRACHSRGVLDGAVGVEGQVCGIRSDKDAELGKNPRQLFLRYTSFNSSHFFVET